MRDDQNDEAFVIEYVDYVTSTQRWTASGIAAVLVGETLGEQVTQFEAYGMHDIERGASGKAVHQNALVLAAVN